MPTVNLTGETYGRWVVLRRSDKGRFMWDCRCSCGTTRSVFGGNLRKGVSTSCGCFSREVCSKRSRRHGGSVEETLKPMFGIYRAMLARCLNPNTRSYKNYGARGVSVCSEWQGAGGFERFVADMGLRPSDDHSIDRIDNEKGYCKENCRWATRVQQARNKRGVEFIGDSPKTLFAKVHGVSLSTAYKVAKQKGQSVREVIINMSEAQHGTTKIHAAQD